MTLVTPEVDQTKTVPETSGNEYTLAYGGACCGGHHVSFKIG